MENHDMASQNVHAAAICAIILLIMTLATGVLVSAAGPESGLTVDERQLEANKALVRRLFDEGFSGGDLAVVEEIFSPDIKLVDPNLPSGIEGIKAIVRKNNEAFDGWSFVLNDVLAATDKVVVRWTGAGIHSNSFMNETPTGKRVELNGLSIYQIKNGRIVTDWVIPDNLQFLIQLGILPPLGMTDDGTSNSGN